MLKNKLKSFTNSVLMIRPANFGFNGETAINNAFQNESETSDIKQISKMAEKEFDAMVSHLRSVGIDVHVWQDSPEPKKPDAVFPNNWFSTTPEGALITYPMFAKNRRIERDPHILDYIEEQFLIDRRYALEHYEDNMKYLEGTGSILFDHDRRTFYACLSPRTDVTLLDKIAVLMGYEMIVFHSVDKAGMPIYHTNVMMALGVNNVVICLESILDRKERERIEQYISNSGRGICNISFRQMSAFAGNMIQLKDQNDEPVLVMSQQAHDSLTKTQLEQLSSSSKLVSPDLSSIETFGGGSARCMIAEIFLEKRVAYT